MTGRPLAAIAAALAALATLGSIGASTASGNPVRAAGAGSGSRTVVAPYVDMGAPELFPTALAAIRQAHLGAVSAGFVTSRSGCTPRWDDGRAVAQDRRQQRFLAAARRSGARPIVSFGGQMNPPTHDLAETCRSVSGLAAAYAAVARRLHVTALDFDIEGARLDEGTSIARRAKALGMLQKQHPAWSISLTVPVMPSGLPGDVRTMLAVTRKAGVRIAVLNLMTMDYGGRHEMGAAAEQAARRSLPQFRRYFPNAGWRSLGLTPMIGRNDVSSEVFTLADARRVASFARSHRVGRMAFWALGRDIACPRPTTTARYDCSGMPQSPYEFSRRFAAAR